MNRPESITDANTSPDADLDCTRCGACCAYSATWPRFTVEDEAALARIPARFVRPSGAGMRCAGNRCTALTGKLGLETACAIYEVRPQVCRDCEPGDDICLLARRHFGLS
jgi:Fe-S-cluster containining protein